MKILFLCVANSARSQLAEGLAKSIFGPAAEIESAGSQPTGKVQPFAIVALKEIGIDITGNISKSIPDLSPRFLDSLDYVITLCAEEICPVLPSKTAKKLHWPIPDPASAPEDEKLKAFREARETIQLKLKEFKNSLSPSR